VKEKMVQGLLTNQQNLRVYILKKKREMIYLGMTYGLSDHRTIICSQELDQLLNMQLKKKKHLVY
jgi:stage 0 sporulation regulatory protein